MNVHYLPPHTHPYLLSSLTVLCMLPSCPRGDSQLENMAITQFIDQPFSYGLDPEHGGLFYFLDVEGHSPTQLEWGMKLWWVHCEALVALLMAYQCTRKEGHWRNFTNICQYAFSKVS